MSEINNFCRNYLKKLTILDQDFVCAKLSLHQQNLSILDVGEQDH